MSVMDAGMITRRTRRKPRAPRVCAASTSAGSTLRTVLAIDKHLLEKRPDDNNGNLWAVVDSENGHARVRQKRERANSGRIQ